MSQLNSKRLSCFSNRCICRTGRKAMVKRMKISPAEVLWSFEVVNQMLRSHRSGFNEFVLNLFELMFPCPLGGHVSDMCDEKGKKKAEFREASSFICSHGIWLRQWQCSRSCPWPRWIPMSRLGRIKKAGRLAARSASNFEFIRLKISVEILSLQGVRSAVSALGRGNTPASAESPVGVQCLVEALWQMIVVLRMKLQRSLEVS